MDAHLVLVIAGGLFSLSGVLLGGLLSPLTQLLLERKRERRTADRAMLLIAGELLHAQMMLRTVSEGANWPHIEDLESFLPTSAWRENRAAVASFVSEDLFRRLVIAYTLLEHDRTRFAVASKIPAGTPLTPEVAKDIKESSNELGRLRRQLGLGGGWLDEIQPILAQEP